MLTRFPRISRVATKLLEISGAACASALAAVLLGNMREPAQPAVTPAVVRLAPADEQMIRYVREEGAALVEQLRTASDALNASVPASVPSKPAKAAASSPLPRREQKANHAPAAEPKQRLSEPLPTQSSSPSSVSEPMRPPAANAPISERMPPPPSLASEIASVSTQTQVPLRIWPDAAAGSLRDAPRPPRGVGEFLSSSM